MNHPQRVESSDLPRALESRSASSTSSSHRDWRSASFQGSSKDGGSSSSSRRRRRRRGTGRSRPSRSPQHHGDRTKGDNEAHAAVVGGSDLSRLLLLSNATIALEKTTTTASNRIATKARGGPTQRRGEGVNGSASGRDKDVDVVSDGDGASYSGSYNASMTLPPPDQSVVLSQAQAQARAQAGAGAEVHLIHPPGTITGSSAVAGTASMPAGRASTRWPQGPVGTTRTGQPGPQPSGYPIDG